MIEDNSDQTSNLVSYRLIFKLYSIIFIRWGKVCLSLFNIPIILEHLLDTFSECFFQFTCVSRVSPRKLNSSTFSMIVLHILGVSVFTYLLCMWNNINLVLAILTPSDFNFRNQNVVEGAIFFIWNQYSNIVRKKLSNYALTITVII